MNNLTTNRMIEYQSNDPSPRLPPTEPPRRSPFMTIWNRKWIVLICVAVCLNAAVARYYLSTKIYTSAAQLVVSQGGVSMTDANGGPSNNLYREAELITKPVLLIALKKDPSLAKLPTFTDTPGNPIGVLQNIVHTSVGKNDGVISISCDSAHPADAQVVVNAVIEAYMAYHSDQKSLSSRTFLSENQPKRDKWFGDYNEKIKEQTQFIKEHGDVVAQGTSLQQRLDAAEEAFVQSQKAARETGAAYEQQLKMVRNVPATGADVTSGTTEGQLLADLSTFRSHYDSLISRGYGPNHPAIQQVVGQLDRLNAQYAQLLHQKVALAEQSQNEALKKRDDLKKSLEEARVRAAEYKRLEADIQQTEKMLGSLDEDLKKAKVGADTPPFRVDVIDEAKLPDKPTKPDLKMLTFQGGLIGLVLGLILALADQKLRSVSEIMAAANLPVLGVVPRMSGRLTLTSRGRKVHLDPMSDVAEAFRQVRTAVYFGVPEDRAKTILITSATRGDGKSTLASNLAIAMAESGQHVLIVDADLREPMQHRIFSATADKGVTSIVSGRATLDRAIQATAIKGLDILPCGPIPLNPAEIVNNQAFADVLDALAQRYDRIILDAPPVMPVTDARILAATCDVTILVLRAEKSTRSAAADARDGLLGFGANLLGVVVNGAARRKGRYGIYGGYGLRRHAKINGQHLATDPAGTDMVVAKR